MKKIKSLKDSGLLIKGVTQTTENKTREQRGGFLGMLLTTLDESLLEKILAYRGVIKVGDLEIRAAHGFSYHVIP